MNKMALSSPALELWNFLTKDSSAQERIVEQAWVHNIESSRDALLSSSKNLSQAIALLSMFRGRKSNSLLRSPKAISRWNQAQILLHQWISEERAVSLSDVQHLNSLLSGSEKTQWRKVNIFTTQVKHIAPEDLDVMMTAFWNHLKTVRAELHPLYEAFSCRYWILSIHPFEDANGRTSQLLADFFLLKEGFLPQVFLSHYEGNLIGDPHKKSFLTPHEAFKRFCHTILNAYQIMEAFSP